MLGQVEYTFFLCRASLRVGAVLAIDDFYDGCFLYNVRCRPDEVDEYKAMLEHVFYSGRQYQREGKCN